MLYFPSITAIRYNKRLKEFFIKFTSKGRKKMIGIIEVIRKMVHIIYEVLKNGEEYKEAVQKLSDIEDYCN